MTTENPEVPVITYEPATYYTATVVCRTEGCEGEGVPVAVQLYSNNGDPDYIRVQHSVCRQWMVILSATKMDPQPPEE